MNIKKLAVCLILFLLLVFGSILRFYKLDENPPSITWDEASVGYNAYTIAHWGKDEWGKILPLAFKSFGDDKNPVHIYLTVPFVGLFGLNEYSVRSSSAFFGVLNILAIFFLVRKITKNDIAGLFASFIFTISPTALHFSRFNHEMQFALFFALFGFYFVLEGLENNKKLIPLGFLFLGIDLLTYQSAKVVTFPAVIFLIILNFKKFMKVKKAFIFGILIYVFFVSLLFFNPQLLGGARFEQNKIADDSLIKIGFRYLDYLSLKFLFLSGDPNPRHSIQSIGHFFWFDLGFLFLGIFGLIKQIIKKNYNVLLFILILFLSPVPAAVSSLDTHFPRAMFLLPSWIILMSLGFEFLISFIKNYKVTFLILLAFIILYIFPFKKYWHDYFNNYSRNYAIEWVYGMKEIVEFAKANNFYRVYITDARGQPYIFSLFYEKTNLLDFLSTVKYNDTISRSYNLVKSFDKYRFMWDDYHSQPVNGVLYVVKPSVYTGLYEKDYFDVVKLVKYPNNTDAFYLIVSKNTGY